MSWKVVWRYVSTEPGALSAVMDSVKVMPMSFVHNLVLVTMVCQSLLGLMHAIFNLLFDTTCLHVLYAGNYWAIIIVECTILMIVCIW